MQIIKYSHKRGTYRITVRWRGFDYSGGTTAVASSMTCSARAATRLKRALDIHVKQRRQGGEMSASSNATAHSESSLSKRGSSSRAWRGVCEAG